jgi:hypothetical protein
MGDVVMPLATDGGPGLKMEGEKVDACAKWWLLWTRTRCFDFPCTEYVCANSVLELMLAA